MWKSPTWPQCGRRHSNFFLTHTHYTHLAPFSHSSLCSPDPSFPHAHAVMRVRACACTRYLSFPDPFCARARNLKLGGGERPGKVSSRPRGGWTRPRDVCGIIAFQSTGLRECMGKAVRFSAQFHQGASNRIWRNSRTL